MPKAILICGKICSGKSTYVKKLMEQDRAVMLSCDELVLSILGSDLGERHDEVLQRVKKYLYTKSSEILAAGVNVILEWGFWKREDREYARRFFEKRGYSSELHYIDISDERWKANIAKRNHEVSQGDTGNYFVDEGLLAKLEGLFEAPDSQEVDVRVKSVL